MLVERNERGRDGWRETSVEEIAEKIAMGPFGSDITTDNFVPSGVPVIRGGNLTAGRFRAENFVFLTDEKADRLAGANAYPGDVVFTHRGTLGQVGLIPDTPFQRYVISQSQMKLTCRTSEADPAFLYYFFKSPLGQHALLTNTSQTGVPAISRPVTSLKSIRLLLPPLPEQRAIAHILGTLDDKIELNRRMNETLESMARALFKSWFVDFDPVRAKMEGRDTGLPKPISDLFPDRLVDSERGEIPEGWKIKSLREYFRLTMGQSPPGNTYNDRNDGLPFFQGRTDFGFRFPENRKFCTAPTQVAQPGDTLVSVRAPVGDINMAWEECCIGRGVAALRHQSGSSSFTYYSAQAVQNKIREYEDTGTVFGAINRKQFEALQMLEPSPYLVNAFDAQAGPVDVRIRNNVAESRTLTTLRETLLPKLISGEIRIPGVELQRSS